MARREQISRRPRSGLAALCAVGLLAAVGANAAERVVMVEEFTATWCGPCEYAGQAMDLMLDNFPDRVAGVQIHIADAYETSWGRDRQAFYGVTAIPEHVLRRRGRTSWCEQHADHL